jgi:hypothetical protein
MSKIHLQKLRARPISWSNLSSWEWDKKEWAKNYLEGIKNPTNAEMEFGSAIGKRLETDPTFLPMIPRHSKMEHPFNVSLAGIKLTGFADSFCTITNKKLLEFKTGVKKFDQKRVDEMGQLTMYTLMHYITTKVKPEDLDIQLIWMPTKKTEGGDFNNKIEFVDDIENNIKIFKTKRTMVQILKFAQYIQETYKAMEEFALNYEPGV